MTSFFQNGNFYFNDIKTKKDKREFLKKYTKFIGLTELIEDNSIKNFGVIVDKKNNKLYVYNEKNKIIAVEKIIFNDNYYMIIS